MQRVYLDHNATTPLNPRVTKAMVRAFEELQGNPSSIHREGQRARAAVERARRQVADLIGGLFTEIVFTSGASEANNIAIRALATRGPLMTTVAEHPSILGPITQLEQQGHAVVRLGLTPNGELPSLEQMLSEGETAGVCGVSVMMANNETGNIFPIQALVEAAHKRGWWVHCDATQAIGKIPVDVAQLGVDFLSLSGHKFYGPKGIGALYVRDGLDLLPLIVGGHQERGRRAGTENVPAIVGLGVAAELAQTLAQETHERLAMLRDRLWDGIHSIEPAAVRQGNTQAMLPNTLNVRFEGVDGETLLMNLDLEGIAVSAGSACTAGSLEPSHVILAMGVPYQEARGSIRFSLGTGTTEDEIRVVLERLPHILELTRTSTWT